ncbi:MAG: FAD-dependent oxidoreductase [Chloroflexi bacterium]|nr:FAD-dependent oxidoreductase [Chloroflexota bacterium]
MTTFTPGRRTRVVIVGAGFGGLRAARALNGHGLDVILVDRQNYHLFQPLLYQVAIGGLDPGAITAPVRTIIRNWPDVRFRLAEVHDVDFEGREVHTTNGPISYDYLILAAGSVTNFFGQTQVEQQAFDLKHLDDALALRNHILSALERANEERDPEARHILLTFVVVGGGPTGVEFTGAVAELLRHSLHHDYPDLQSEQGRVILIEAGESVFGTFPPDLQRYGLERLNELGVEIRLGTAMSDVQGDRVTLKDGSMLRAGTLLWSAGVRAAPLARALDVPKARAGRLVVGPDLSLADRPEVFVIGDLAYREQDGAPLPQLATPAIQQGSYVAKVITLGRERGRPAPPFRYRDPGTMATIGRAAAIASFPPNAIRNLLPFLRWGPFRWLPLPHLCLTGLVAWAMWLGLHLWELIGFRNRLVALLDWAYAYVRFDSVVRVISGPRRSLAVDTVLTGSSMADRRPSGALEAAEVGAVAEEQSASPLPPSPMPRADAPAVPRQPEPSDAPPHPDGAPAAARPESSDTPPHPDVPLPRRGTRR